MNYLYSNLNQPLIPSNINNLKQMNLKGLIVDFECDSDLCSFLENNNIKENYYRIKLYELDLDNIGWGYIEEEVKKAFNFGFYGFAIDGEPYSGIKIWETNPKKIIEFSECFNRIIKKYFNNLIIYPENLGREKYLYYNFFINGISKDLNTKILMERTYNVWKPWDIFILYNRTKKEYKNAEIIIGVWYESMVDCIFYKTLPLPIRKLLAIIPQFFQFLSTKFHKNRFYYSETTEFLNSKWLKFLSK